MNLIKASMIVKEYIEEKMGGNVVVDSSREEIGMVIFTWNKNDKTIFAEHFQRAYSQEELEQAVDPKLLGQHFLESYARSKELHAALERHEQEPIEESIELAVDEEVKPADEDGVEPVDDEPEI